MARRVSLPAADDLFRPTAERPTAERPDADGRAGDDAAAADPAPRQPASPTPATRDGEAEPAGKRPSGRVRHDEKMTVYITSEELLEIEHARLSLRRSHGLAVDRGRLVREAVALALADLETRGDDSALVQRLREG